MGKSERYFAYACALSAVFMMSGAALAGVNGHAVEEIPTLSKWGFVIMGIGLLSLGVRFLRRRGASDPR